MQCKEEGKEIESNPSLQVKVSGGHVLVSLGSSDTEGNVRGDVLGNCRVS